MNRSACLRRILLTAFPLAAALNLTAPANGQCRCPQLLGIYDTPGQARNVAVAGNVAYVADGYGGLQLIDVSDPTAPTLLGSYDPGTQYAWDVAVAGNVAYVAFDEAGLVLVDVSDPTDPVLLGAYVTFGEALAVVVSGNVAYVADWDLRVIDVSDPRNPTLLGYSPMLGPAEDVAVSGNIAYVAADWFGLRLIDVSDPTAPPMVGSYEPPGYNAISVDVSGSTAYVASDSEGLQLIDGSVPTSPTLLGSYDVLRFARNVTVSGNVAYVIDGNSDLQVIDVSAPTDLVLLGSYNTPDSTIGVAVSNGVAYVASLTGGLHLVDVSNVSVGPLLGTTYCDPGVPNATGSPGVLSVDGSDVAADDDLALTASNLPGLANGNFSKIGYFIMGTGTNTFVPPGSIGPICVTPGLQRFLPSVSNTRERGDGFRRCVGTGFFPRSPILAGETWNFQVWHRDEGQLSNFTNAVSITFQ